MSLFNPKCCVCEKNAGITAVANKELTKMLCPSCRKKITSMGYWYQNINTEQCIRIVQEYDSKDFNVDLENCLANIDKNKFVPLLRKYVDEKEKIFVLLRGAHKEYLICTDRKVYIIKEGFMTGHTFGSGIFKISYESITNVEIDFHLLSGYFEISTGGIQNKKYNYWSSDDKYDPAKQPNVISLTNVERADFTKATHIILDKIGEKKSNNVDVNLSTKSVADEIREFKKLLDDGIISHEEFDKKKKELLDK